MQALIKPGRLQVGDTVATISISGGRNSLKGSDYLYRNPKARAEDLMFALVDPEIKGVFSNHGGDDAARLLPYIDFDIVRNNPKVFIGFSDISTIHNMFTYAGVSSFYGASLLSPIAQPGELDAYTAKWTNKVLFSPETVGQVEPCSAWTPITWADPPAEEIVWTKNTGYEVLQGKGRVTGRLIGGCCGPMQQIMGTCLFPGADQWRDGIISWRLAHPMACRSLDSTWRGHLRQRACFGTHEVSCAPA